MQVYIVRIFHIKIFQQRIMKNLGLYKIYWFSYRVNYHTLDIYFENTLKSTVPYSNQKCCLVAKLLVVSDSYGPQDCSLEDSSVHGISQARILEWVSISFFRGSSPPRDWTCVSCTAGWFFTTEPQGKPNQNLEEPIKFLSVT